VKFIVPVEPANIFLHKNCFQSKQKLNCAIDRLAHSEPIKDAKEIRYQNSTSIS
jgi:hypothetical protein